MDSVGQRRPDLHLVVALRPSREVWSSPCIPSLLDLMFFLELEETQRNQETDQSCLDTNEPALRCLNFIRSVMCYYSGVCQLHGWLVACPLLIALARLLSLRSLVEKAQVCVSFAHSKREEVRSSYFYISLRNSLITVPGTGYSNSLRM